MRRQIGVKAIIYLLLFVFALVMISGSVAWHFISNPMKEYEKEQQYTEIIEQCEHYSVMGDRAECVLQNIYEEYKYVRHTKPVSVEQLFENGGDCKHWAVFWAAVGKSYGYRTEYKFVEAMSGAHVFTFWIDRSGYCVLDQRMIHCGEYGGYYQ